MASYQEDFEEQIDYDSQNLKENDSWHGVEDALSLTELAQWICTKCIRRNRRVQ